MPKIPQAPAPKPPKKIKTFQDYNEKVEKKLDKLTKTVYNIRKDAREVQDLFNTYITHGGRLEIGTNGYHDQLRVMLLQRVGSIKELCETNNLPLPTLAGGALSDFIYNTTAKDYDFFFNCKTEEEAYELIDQLTIAMSNHGGYTEAGEGEGYERIAEHEGGEFEGVYGVFNWGAQCQLIVGTWPDCEHIYDRFDLSVCQAEMDLTTQEIVVSQEFLKSVETRTIKNFKPDSIYSTKRKALQEYKLQFHRNPSSNNKKGKVAATYGDIWLSGANPCAEIIWKTMPFERVQEQ